MVAEKSDNEQSNNLDSAVTEKPKRLNKKWEKMLLYLYFSKILYRVIL